MHWNKLVYQAINQDITACKISKPKSPLPEYLTAKISIVLGTYCKVPY